MLAKAWVSNPSTCRIRAIFVVEDAFNHKDFLATWVDMWPKNCVGRPSHQGGANTIEFVQR
jgi:hypothetical protein